MSAFDSRDASSTAKGMHQSEELCRRFSLAEIQSATNDFTDDLVVGKGGFGKVYKGFIDKDGTTTTLVAMKRLNAEESKQGAKEFWTEIEMLSKLRHPHLVTLIGYSDDSKEMILVYEYMSNGTLADHLYKKIISGGLTWEQRLNICIGAARALDYLHSGTDESSVIHRDVKTTNILLDENCVAKISDFGLSKMSHTVSTQSQSHISTDVKGTFGYLDPEYFLTRRLTKKSDVYAFGVVLLEVLCGRPPVDIKLEQEQRSLPLWAQHCIKNGMLDQIIDPSLRSQMINSLSSYNCLKMFAEVASQCLHNHPRGRPTMAEVVERLELIVLASQANNISSSPRKGIITKVFLNISHFLARKSVGLRWQIRQKDRSSQNGPSSRQLQRDPFEDGAIQLCRCFSLKEIRAATKNFHEGRVIGRGGSTIVYLGIMGNLKVAIKKWEERTNKDLDREIRAEIQVQSHLRHLHVVSLIGYCSENHEVILVYEYMVNGSLYHHLYESNNNNQHLTWEKRLEICIGVARGLQYLHEGTRRTFIHRNVVAKNILLDENWVAKISGFELSTVVPENVIAFSTTVLCGTLGYIDPEYFLTAKFTKKTDVYSFGVILLELLCRRKPLYFSLDGDHYYLVRQFKTITIDQIIDPYLVDKIAPECLSEFVKIIENCVRDRGVERPTMEDVLGSLRSALQLQQSWKSVKFYETVCHSHKNRVPDGIMLAHEAVCHGHKNTVSDGIELANGSIGDSDYFSSNLAR